MKLSDLIENPDNPQTVTDEDFAKLVESLREDAVMLEVRPVAFVTDYVSPISGESFAGRRVILDGCKRHRALVAIHGSDAELSDRYFKDLTSFPPEARRRWIVKANVQTGDWDVDKLLKLYSSDELSDLLASDEFEELIGKLEEPTTEGQTDADAVPEVSKDPRSRCGSVYQLGRHRVMCGDSTKAEDVKKLMGGGLADMILTDPPYNVNYGDGSEEKRVNSRPWTRYKKHKPIAGDNFKTDEEFAEKLLRPAMKNLFDFAKDCCAYYMTMPQSGTHMMMMMMMKECGWQVKHELIWVKNAPVLSRADYNYQHEPIMYGWKKTHKFVGGGDYHTSSIWPFDRPHKSEEHPTMKPVPLWVNMIKNSSEEGDTVLDLFGGSGTTAIACEQTSRRAMVMEFETCYVDVIRRRWAEFVYGEGCDWEKLTPEVKA